MKQLTLILALLLMNLIFVMYNIFEAINHENLIDLIAHGFLVMLNGSVSIWIMTELYALFTDDKD